MGYESSEKACMSDNMLDIIIKNSDRRLDAVLSKNMEYRKLGKKMLKCFQKLEKTALTKRQDRAVDRLLTAYNEESACVCRIFYEQGMKDCVSLIRGIGVIR